MDIVNEIYLKRGTNDGWEKYNNNPVLGGGSYGTCFDISVLKENEEYMMFFSWRPKKSIALTKSKDGISWSEPIIVLEPGETEQGWEDDLNRPVIIKHNEKYHMWYTGQHHGPEGGSSYIFYAVSKDGVKWERMSLEPVIYPEEKWEKVATMLPQVIWDENEGLFKMWYAAGENYEPNEIGYATSPDGLNWTKYKGNPIFRADPDNKWEQHKTAVGQVFKKDGWYIMFYIGYYNEHYAQIGIARSRDGITDWQRHPNNPIIAPDKEKWDHDACYKPYTIFDGEKWLLWYNGRQGALEQIGLVYHYGEDLGFDK